jgi:hypothetical protein
MQGEIPCAQPLTKDMEDMEGALDPAVEFLLTHPLSGIYKGNNILDESR